MSECKSCDGYSKSQFCNIKDNALNLLEDAKQNISLKKGEFLFQPGASVNGIYCVSSGSIKQTKINDNGSELLLKVYTKGNVIGYSSIFTQDTHGTFAIAHENTELCFTPKSVIFKMMEVDFQLAKNFLNQMSFELSMNEERFASLINKPVSERIAEALILLKRALPESKWTRKDIADWAGTTQETVIRTLAQFESQDLIAQEGRMIHIRNHNKLLEHSGLSALI